MVKSQDAAFSVVVLGLLLELFIRLLIYPYATYEFYYCISVVFQFILLLSSTYAVRMLRGSATILAYMTLTFVSMCFNITRLSGPAAFWALEPVTAYALSPAYRAVELIIITRFSLEHSSYLRGIWYAVVDKLRCLVLRWNTNMEKVP